MNLPVGSRTLDWRDDRRQPSIAILLDETSAMFVLGNLPSDDEATKELRNAIVAVEADKEWL